MTKGQQALRRPEAQVDSGEKPGFPLAKGRNLTDSRNGEEKKH